MIENVEIHNFRALRDVKVSLARLTVLIGPNNSGKTSFLQAIYQTGLSKTDEVIAWPASDAWRYNPANEIEIQVGGRKLMPFRKLPGNGWELNGADFTPVSFFRLPYDVPMTADGFSDTANPSVLGLGENGENVAAMIDFMLRRARTRFDALETEARTLIPGLQSLNISTPTPETRRLDLVMESGWEMPADSASSGVRLLLFFLTLAHQPDPPKTILIEEPENGIHPRRLEEVMQMLIRLAESPNGPQVILSTHSPYLIDSLDLDKHSVLVFRRDADGGCTARQVDKEKLRPFLNEFMLGEIWMNLGEEQIVAEQKI